MRFVLKEALNLGVAEVCGELDGRWWELSLIRIMCPIRVLDDGESLRLSNTFAFTIVQHSRIIYHTLHQHLTLSLSMKRNALKGSKT